MDEQLNDFSADLLSEKRHEIFLERLFSLGAGTWRLVRSLAGDLPEMQVRLNALERVTEPELYATWLDHPGVARGFCVIIFFSTSTLWSYTALLNKQNVLDKLSEAKL